MSTWIKESKKSWWHKLCIRVLKAGPIPKHVAFIMDGNRRYAKKNSLDRIKGHLSGFDTLAQILDWCLEFEITEVTVYAFSIENFKRSKEEVDELMELSRQKFARLVQEKELIEKHGVRFQVLGNLELLPKDIQGIIAEAVTMTQHNNKAVLNVCFSYTSRDEICHATKEVAEGVQLGLIRESDISERLLEDCMYTHESTDPDLLVRTSGEVRLSDFLLWQSGYSVFSFMRVLWPEFNIYHLYAGILHYQRNHYSVQKAKSDHEQDQDRLIDDSDYKCTASDVNTTSTEHSGLSNGFSFDEKVQNYTRDRKARIEAFLEHVRTKRQHQFSNMLCGSKS